MRELLDIRNRELVVCEKTRKAIKRSKFAKIISNLDDRQLKALYVILANEDSTLRDAIKCWYTASASNNTQIAALLHEINARGLN